MVGAFMLEVADPQRITAALSAAFFARFFFGSHLVLPIEKGVISGCRGNIPEWHREMLFEQILSVSKPLRHYAPIQLQDDDWCAQEALPPEMIQRASVKGRQVDHVI